MGCSCNHMKLFVLLNFFEKEAVKTNICCLEKRGNDQLYGCEP